MEYIRPRNARLKKPAIEPRYQRSHSTRHENSEFSGSRGNKAHENIATVHKSSFYLLGPNITARSLDAKPLRR